jgi:hypothetical protein
MFDRTASRSVGPSKPDPITTKDASLSSANRTMFGEGAVHAGKPEEPPATVDVFMSNTVYIYGLQKHLFVPGMLLDCERQIKSNQIERLAR